MFMPQQQPFRPPPDWMSVVQPDQLAQFQPGPSGIMGLLGRPGVREGLLHTGLALMAQKDQRGTLGGALGRAVPYGLEVGSRAAKREQYEKMLEGAPEQMQAVLRMLEPEQGAMMMAQMMGPQERDIREVGDRLIEVTDTGTEVLYDAPDETGPVTLSEGSQLVDPVTGEPIAVNPRDTSREDRAREFTQTDQLADSFFQATIDDREVANAVATAKAATESAVGDQTRIIALNKLLDPASIVRESEFARVGQAGGLESRAQYFFNQMVDGRLPENLRRELDAELDAQLNTRRASFQQTLDRFRFRAEAAGLDPAKVVQDYYERFGVPDVDLKAKYGLR